MKEKLRLIKKDKLDYIVPVPEKVEGIDTTIRIAFRCGEYQYIPRKYTFLNDVRFTYDELQAIVDELKRLNNQK